MTTTPSSDDDRYLDLLGILHWVLGGVVALFSLFPVIHVAIGLMALSGQLPGMAREEGRIFGILFAGLGSAFILMGMALAAVLIAAGFSLRARRRHPFCLVAAAVSCLFMPLGTILGVFTIVLLMKPEISAAFAAKRDQNSAGPRLPA